MNPTPEWYYHDDAYEAAEIAEAEEEARKAAMADEVRLLDPHKIAEQLTPEMRKYIGQAWAEEDVMEVGRIFMDAIDAAI